jgi:hypothetical protein
MICIALNTCMILQKKWPHQLRMAALPPPYACALTQHNIYTHMPPPAYTLASQPASQYIRCTHLCTAQHSTSPGGLQSPARRGMAHLPPRAPSAGSGAQDPWSEFHGFAAARRGAHRRSASDSAAFLESVPMDDVIGGAEFDRLDDEQLMSMFSDVDAPAVSDGAGDRAGEPQLMDVGDAEDTSPAGARAAAQVAADGTTDPKRVKRLVSTGHNITTVQFTFLLSISTNLPW